MYIKPKLILMVFLILIMLTLFGCAPEAEQDIGDTEDTPEVKEDIKIGVIIPLSGGSAYSGENILNAIEFAVEEVNAKGGLLDGRKVTIIVEDDMGDPSQGTSAAHKLIEQDNVCAILGTLNSPVTLAVKEITHRAGVPQVTVSAAADSVTDPPNDWIFRPHLYNQLQSRQIAGYAAYELNAKTVAILFENTDWGRGLDQELTGFFDEFGVEVISREGYDPGLVDFSGIITKLRELDPDVILAFPMMDAAVTIAKQSRELGLDASKFFGAGAFTDSRIVELADGAEEGIKMTPWFWHDIPGVPEAAEFSDAFLEKYGYVPDTYTALGYTPTIVLFDAIERAGTTDREAIRDALVETNLRTPDGLITFDENHNARVTVFVGEYRDGEIVLLPNQPRPDY